MLVVLPFEIDKYGVVLSYNECFVILCTRAAFQHLTSSHRKRPGRTHLFPHQFASVAPVRHNDCDTHSFSFTVSHKSDCSSKHSNMSLINLVCSRWTAICSHIWDLLIYTLVSQPQTILEYSFALINHWLIALCSIFYGLNSPQGFTLTCVSKPLV